MIWVQAIAQSGYTCCDLVELHPLFAIVCDKPTLAKAKESSKYLRKPFVIHISMCIQRILFDHL